MWMLGWELLLHITEITIKIVTATMHWIFMLEAKLEAFYRRKCGTYNN